MPGPLRALSLDLDGTLADTLGICVETFQDVIERLQGTRPSAAEVVAGGPMMGLAQANLDAPITKGTTGIVVPAASRTPCLRRSP